MHFGIDIDAMVYMLLKHYVVHVFIFKALSLDTSSEHRFLVCYGKDRFLLSVRSFSGQSPSSPCSKAGRLPEHLSEPQANPDSRSSPPGKIHITLSGHNSITFTNITSEHLRRVKGFCKNECYSL